MPGTIFHVTEDRTCGKPVSFCVFSSLGVAAQKNQSHSPPTPLLTPKSVWRDNWQLLLFIFVMTCGRD